MEEIKDKIIEVLNNSLDCDAIVIFGSFARGTQNEESDIDIALKINKEVTKKELYDISTKLEEQLKRDIDLVNLDTIENDGFKYEILINGEVIYCKDSYKFDLYKLDAYREYLDLNESWQRALDTVKMVNGQ